MGQVFRRLQELERECVGHHNYTTKTLTSSGFPDLRELPPELSLAVLSYLNATDLCLAACVWDTLGNDELLWLSLCKASWGEVSVYDRWQDQPEYSYKRLYLLLDEASLTFNVDPLIGMDYLFRQSLVDDNPVAIANFLHSTKRLNPDMRREFLYKRRDVLHYLIRLQNLHSLFLPTALRQFFSEVSAPGERGSYLTDMIEMFSDQYCRCNPNLGLSKDTVFILCFSLIMLSVDLCSPHVKNKMSKREFIRNTRRAAHEIQDDLAGHLYDNIYLVGHVAIAQKAITEDHTHSYRIIT
ncbi:F-box only protein 8-like [Octopus vulgaris]|uniref:F-box only protein 8-like n=2 Tax=Octopus TaxID=6643 RepID=A0AA36C2N6_OCTVU|nr:F-box only protein 8-like [Octopus sinensis]XP_036370812.1 F-box only protein 8-like [Octopus sinensis]CAI9744437.1 F-box only protein 8-like [Octopus vulgaris]